MTEVAGRRRRPDSNSKPNGKHSERSSYKRDTRSRSRSPSRERVIKGRRADRERDERERTDGRRSYRGNELQSISGSGLMGYADDGRDRSRSPTRHSTRPSDARQRSPPRGPGGRDRDRGRDRDGDVSMNGRSKNKHTNPPTGPSKKSGEEDSKSRTAPPPEDEDDEAAMRRVMGFGMFKTTKNTKVPGNDKNYAVSKNKTIEYRQYMNRKGGFNRPLSPSR
jgi:U4/U6.U5 tri-snRNP-associated protein 3